MYKNDFQQGHGHIDRSRSIFWFALIQRNQTHKNLQPRACYIWTERRQYHTWWLTSALGSVSWGAAGISHVVYKIT